MPSPIFLLYADETSIYAEHGAVKLPLARCVRTRATEKAWLLENLDTDAEAWFPEKCFGYHWHVTSPTQMQPMVTVPAWLRGKKREFFER